MPGMFMLDVASGAGRKRNAYVPHSPAMLTASITTTTMAATKYRPHHLRNQSVNRGQDAGMKTRATTTAQTMIRTKTPENFSDSTSAASTARTTMRKIDARRPARQAAYTPATSAKLIATSLSSSGPCARKFGSSENSATATTAAIGPAIFHAHQPIIAPSATAMASITARERASTASASAAPPSVP